MAKPDKDGIRIVATNKKVYHDYTIEETWEAGIVLDGGEVKMLRAGQCVLPGSHVRILHGEAFLFGMSIPEYPWAHQFAAEPSRSRKLLLHQREIMKLERELVRKGTSCVVTRVYFKGAKVKVEIALGTGKKEHDKRHDVKAKEANREIARALR